MPRLKIPKDRATEAEWQHLLRERDALAKLRQREYADSRRRAEHNIIAEGDEILLRQTCENKLSPSFEPKPYKVIQKCGNAVVIEGQEGDRKMRNAAHIKKLTKEIEPESEDLHHEQIKPTETPNTAPESMDVPPLPPDPPANLASRPARTRQPPVWAKDYVFYK